MGPVLEKGLEKGVKRDTVNGGAYRKTKSAGELATDMFAKSFMPSTARDIASPQ